MLHQSRTLEAPAADKSQERRETRRGALLAGDMVEVSGAERLPSLASSDAKIAGRKSGNSRVFVLGKNKQPLMPCHPARARELLREGKAVVHRRFPFAIRLKGRSEGATQPVAIKLDPGAKTTGVAIVRQESNPKIQHVLSTFELTHRGAQIRDSLTQRRGFRRSRRNRKTRYRAPRFLNRGGDKRGWLPPSLRHRVETTLSWTRRLCRWAPIAGIVVESVRFDTQAMQDPEVSGVDYQQGELAGYEVREYLLEKWERRCAYCDKHDVPLQIEHIVPRSRGGSNRVSNLTLACEPCNQKKGNTDAREFLAHKPEVLQRILTQAKQSLVAAAAVNATRFALVTALQATGLPVVTSTGGRTKFNRTRFGLTKTHANDAACVGEVDGLNNATINPLLVRCTGRGSRQRTRLTAAGFPRGYLDPRKRHFGFQTGDIVAAVVPSGKKRGHHFGRVAVRASGSFNIQTAQGTVQGISHQRCGVIQRADGYSFLQPKSNAQRRRSSHPVNRVGIHAVSL